PRSSGTGFGRPQDLSPPFAPIYEMAASPRASVTLKIPVQEECRPWSVHASGKTEAAARNSAQRPHETFRRRRPLARTAALEVIKTSSPKKLRRRPWFVLARSKIQAAASAAAR